MADFTKREFSVQLELAVGRDRRRTISPFRELGAYETLWQETKASFRRIAEKFAQRPGAIPSDFVPEQDALRTAQSVFEKLNDSHIDQFGVRVHGAAEYPEKLRDARHPVELLYYRGWWDLVHARGVAVVGTRDPSREAVARTRKLVKALIQDRFMIVSGLAKGIDTIAHTAALEEGAPTIAIIGTPLSHTYPRDNAELQDEIATNFLLISQVPLLRYESQDYRSNRLFFPERNKTMSALTEATVIVEAGETSGTLIQARAALEQGRKLFILDNCFRNAKVTWPNRFAKMGAIRVRDYDDIQHALSE